MENDPKSLTSRRTLPLPDRLVTVLKAAKARQAAERLALGSAYRSGAYLVSNEIGDPYSPAVLSRYWRDAVKAAGVRHIKLHAPHTCATLMHLQGIPVAVIAAWPGRRFPVVPIMSPNRNLLLCRRFRLMRFPQRLRAPIPARRPSFLPAVFAGALNGVDVDNLLRSSASTLAVVRQGRHDRRHRFVESAACARFRRPFHRAFMSYSGPFGERPGDDGRCQQATGRPGPFRLPRG